MQPNIFIVFPIIKPIGEIANHCLTLSGHILSTKTYVLCQRREGLMYPHLSPLQAATATMGLAGNLRKNKMLNSYMVSFEASPFGCCNKQSLTLKISKDAFANFNTSGAIFIYLKFRGVAFCCL